MLVGAILLALWVTLVGSGYVYFGLASLDPHNPAQLPGPAGRLFWSAVASTALLAAPLLDGKAALFCASLAVGTVLSAALNDPIHLRKDEESSRLVRFLWNMQHRLAGSLLLKLFAAAIGWLSALLWAPLWLLMLTAFAGFSIQGRAGALLLLARDPDWLGAVQKEHFNGEIPPLLSTLGEVKARVIRNTPDRELRKDLPNPLAEKLIRSKRREEFLDRLKSNVILRQMLWTLGSLLVWIGIAAGIMLATPHIGISATNYSSAYGLIAGVFLGHVFEYLFQ